MFSYTRVFFVGVPSSATYLENFNDPKTVKTWNSLKTTYPGLDPQLSSQLADVSITVKTMNWCEEFTRPKDVLALHVKVKGNLHNLWLNLPSILVLLFDQTDRLRGKLYIQESSEDCFLTGDDEVEYAFWFKIPSNMRGQNYWVIVELFGVVETTKSVDFQKIYSHDYFYGTVQPFMERDEVYGTLPSWYYPEDSVTNIYRYLMFLTYNQTESSIPQYVSVYSLAFYSWAITGMILTFSAFVVLARNKLIAYWKRNTAYVTFAILFVFFFTILFVFVISTH